MPPDARQKMIKQFAAKNRGAASDARSGNPRMGRHKGKGGYAIPYADDTNRSPYRPGRRGKN